MKYTKFAVFLFLSVLFQMSFLRLISRIPFLPDIPFIILFVLSYHLPRFGFFILVVFTGVMIDLFSAMYFGSSVLALMGAFFICYFVRGYILKGKSFGNIFLCSSMVFISFYIFLYFSNQALNSFGGNNFTFDLFNKNLVLEFILNAICAAGLVYFLEGKINYVDIRKHKRLFKISD